jgi:hypothetical protein
MQERFLFFLRDKKIIKFVMGLIIFLHETQQFSLWISESFTGKRPLDIKPLHNFLP